jgi:hypothetical protein
VCCVEAGAGKRLAVGEGKRMILGMIGRDYEF